MSGPLELARRVVLEGLQSAKRKRMLGVEAYDTDSEDERKEEAPEDAAYASYIDQDRIPGMVPGWCPRGTLKRVKSAAEIAFDEAGKQKRERRKERGRKLRERARKEAENLSPKKKKKMMIPKGPWVHKPPVNGKNKTAKLSDELLLRVLKNLDMDDITKCSRVNKRWRQLTGDGEVWRGLYYHKFVKREVMRPFSISWTVREHDARAAYKLEREWLAETKKQDMRKKADTGVWGGSHGEDRTPWMARYKLASNWWKGKAQVSIIHVNDGQPLPKSDTAPSSPKPAHRPVVQVVNGTLYTADAEYGLRAWHLRNLDRSQGTSTSWDEYVAMKTKDGIPMAMLQASLKAVPTAMKIEAHIRSVSIAIGFEDGSWSLWESPHRGQPYFKQICSSDETEISDSVIAPGGPIVEIALRSPYVFTITSTQLLRLHELIPTDSKREPLVPLMLYELTSHTSFPPYALSIRSEKRYGAPLIASIAYAIPSFGGDFSIGMQEIHLDDETGKILETKISTSLQGGWFPLRGDERSDDHDRRDPTYMRRSKALTYRRGSNLTLAHNHPHIVVGSGNNGLWKYACGEGPEETMVKTFSELLGHTSGVVAVDVDKKGKCVSVQRGGGVAVRWLDGMGENQMDADAHVRAGVTAEMVEAMGMTHKDFMGGDGWEKEWVGSDEERIVVLRAGKVIIYDFR